MRKTIGATLLVIAILAVQVFDVAIHVASDQVEPIRILSNILLGLWAAASLAGKSTPVSGAVAIGAYVVLNLVFLAMNGLTNPEQGDALRVPLFVLVGLSTALSLWLRAKTGRN